MQQKESYNDMIRIDIQSGKEGKKMISRLIENIL
jgi:hypothetical protein